MTSGLNNCQTQIENILVMVNAYGHDNDFVCDRNKHIQLLTIFKVMRPNSLCQAQANEGRYGLLS